MKTKMIDPAALASITTGILMVEFSDMHEAMEAVMGHPVFTHQMPALRPKMHQAVLDQFPDMPTEKPKDWMACRDAVRTKYGKKVEVQIPNSKNISPFDHLPEGVKVMPPVNLS